MSGIASKRGVFVKSAGRLHRMPATAQPVAQWVAELDLCPVCGEPVCECIPPAEWAAMLERIDADPHGRNDLSGIELPY